MRRGLPFESPGKREPSRDNADEKAGNAPDRNKKAREARQADRRIDESINPISLHCAPAARSAGVRPPVKSFSWKSAPPFSQH